jgi:ADP-ribosyl-[dinitrogen reductase] hydrolase
MRCWPVALVYHDDLACLIDGSMRQSHVTHAHAECGAACAFVNIVLADLLHGVKPGAAVSHALANVEMPPALRIAIEAAPFRSRNELVNSGWVRHTVESAIWGLLTTDCYEDALVNVVNLGNDADTAGAVVGALAGAAYGLAAIPLRWQEALRGEWPMGSGRYLGAQDLIDLSIRLIEAGQAYGAVSGQPPQGPAIIG